MIGSAPLLFSGSMIARRESARWQDAPSRAHVRDSVPRCGREPGPGEWSRPQNARAAIHRRVCAMISRRTRSTSLGRVRGYGKTDRFQSEEEDCPCVTGAIWNTRPPSECGVGLRALTCKLRKAFLQRTRVLLTGPNCEATSALPLSVGWDKTDRHGWAD